MTRTSLFKPADASLYNAHDNAVSGREGSFVRISKEALIDLVVKAQNGDARAKDAVCREVFRYVLQRVAKFKKPFVDKLERDDLFQAGMQGVLTAIEKFDADLGFSFLTYLTPWIDQHIDREYRNTFSELHVPNHIWESYNRLMVVYREILIERSLQDEDYELTITKEMLIERVLSRKFPQKKQVSRETLELAHTYIIRGGRGLYTSLDQSYGADEEGKEKTLADILEDENYSSEKLENDILVSDTAKNVHFYLKYLDRRSRYVLMRRFGLGSKTEETQTLEEVGKELGITRERIRQVEAKAIMSVKRLMTLCREMDPAVLEETMRAMYKRRPPKPFVLPESVILTDEEKRIMECDLCSEMGPSTGELLRDPLSLNRYKGRIVPDWFDAEQLRPKSERKNLKNRDLNEHELLVRFSMFGKRDLSPQQVREYLGV